MHYSRNTLLSLIIASAASTAFAQEHRQHDAHEHGGGQLNVALEKNQLMVDLSLPAMNVVGFEHPASNQQEKDQLTRAQLLLKDGVSLMGPSPTAGCKLLNVTVESMLLEDDQEHAAMQSAHTDDAEHHDGEGEHADFDVSYEFDCKQPAELSQLSLSLFSQFPGTQHLEAQVITPTLQTGAELSADNPVVKLK